MAAGAVLSTVGTIVSANDAASAARAEGKQAQQVGDWQAAQARQAAGQERASAQRQAELSRKEGRLAVSRARALAAGSGGGANDPTVQRIYGDLSSQAEMNAMNALWEGEESATGLEMQAGAAEFEGSAANQAGKIKSRAYRRAGYIGAAGNMLSSSSGILANQAEMSFYEKYSGGTN
jgi:hypothetical protein